MERINKYLKECWANYKSDIDLPENYNYLYGNPVKVHVPIDIAQNRIMVIGAYPTAHFNTIKGIRDVPIEDHLYPFSNEKYFDGGTVRSVKSGQELEDFYFSKLCVKREQCWITDLVKVFLFKEGHIKKYQQLGYNKQKETRSQFKQFAKKSIPHLHKEIELAKPKVILTLGSEVASIVLNVSENKAKQLMKAEAIEYKLNDNTYTLFALPHPGIIMRNSEVAIKWQKVLEQQLSLIKTVL